MHQYYKEKKNFEKQKETLISLLECDDTRGLYKLYYQCKNELNDEDFIKEEKKILSIIKKRSIPAYFDILMDKNETKEVIEYITHTGWGIDQGHRYSKKLSTQYPHEVIELYWKEANSYIRLGKEINYKHAARVLKEIRQIMKKNNLLDEWKYRYSLLLQEHSRKKLLLKELESLKL